MKFWPLRNIPFFKKGETRTLILSKEANELVAVANAIRNMEIKRGIRDKVTLSEERITIEYKSTASDSAGGSGGDPTWLP